MKNNLFYFTKIYFGIDSFLVNALKPTYLL